METDSDKVDERWSLICQIVLEFEVILATYFSYSLTQYAPKNTVLKLAHLERACAFVDGA
jgi:hypothetical protein